MSDLRDFEDELRLAMRGAAGEAPAPVGLADRLIGAVAVPVRAGATPRVTWWRLRPAVAAGAVLVVAAGVVVGVSHARGGSPASPGPANGGEVVPWSGLGLRAATTASLLFAQPIGAPQDMRDCTDTDFTLVSAQSAPTQPGVDGPAGWVDTSFVLRSTATSACAVLNYGVPVDLVDADGSVLPDDMPASLRPMLFPPSLLVRPGQLLASGVVWAWVPGRAPRPARLAILPAATDSSKPSTRLAVSLTDVAIPADPANPTSGARWRSGWAVQADRVTDAGSLDSLFVVPHAPLTVVDGAVLTYTVELANRSDVPVSLADCPDFAEVLAVVPVKAQVTVGFRGPLNCARAPATIAPRSSVTFAFELDTDGLVTGGGRLTWALGLGKRASVQATAMITVVPR